MTSIVFRPRERKPLPLAAILAIAFACAAVSVVAIPAPHQPPGGFANAAEPASPGATPETMPDVTVALKAVGNGVGNLADAVISLPATQLRR